MSTEEAEEATEEKTNGGRVPAAAPAASASAPEGDPAAPDDTAGRILALLSEIGSNQVNFFVIKNQCPAQISDFRPFFPLFPPDAEGGVPPLVLGAKPGKVNDRLSDGEGGKRKRAKEKRERNYFREWTRTRGKGEEKGGGGRGRTQENFFAALPLLLPLPDRRLLPPPPWSATGNFVRLGVGRRAPLLLRPPPVVLIRRGEGE